MSDQSKAPESTTRFIIISLCVGMRHWIAFPHVEASLLLMRMRLVLQIKASKKVNFQDIVKLEILSDDEQIVLVSLRSRTMRLAVKDSVAFVCAIQRNMKV